MKEFEKLFKKRSISQISKLENITIGENRALNNRFVRELAELFLKQNKNQSIILGKGLIPPIKKYLNNLGKVTSNKFMKHAPDLKLPRYNSLISLEKSFDFHSKLIGLPKEHIKNLYSNLSHYFYSGYTFKPFYGTLNRTTRKVSLTENIKATIIYVATQKSDVKVKPYDDAKRVKKEGAEVVVKVKSRTTGNENELKITSFPLNNNITKWAIAYAISTDHTCKLKRYRNLSYQQEKSSKTSGVINFCAHDIAAYHFATDYYYNKEKNSLPYRISPFLIPTQEAIDLFFRLNNNIIVRKTTDGTDKINKNTFRHTYDAENEIIFNALTDILNFDFLFKPKKGVKIKNYRLQEVV